MFDENNIEVLATSESYVRSGFWSNILSKVMSIFLLVVLTSYQNPTPRIAEFQVSYKTIDLQLNLQGKAYGLVDYNNPETFGTLNGQLNVLLQRFFEERDFLPAWTTEYNANSNLNSLINLLDSAKYFGFPFDYFGNQNLKVLKSNFAETLSLSSRASLELASTLSALKFMLYLKHGIVERDSLFSFSASTDSFPSLLNNAANDNFRLQLVALQPDLAKFERIKKSLPNFIDLHYSIKYTTPKLIDEKLLAKALFYAGISETAELDTTLGNVPALLKLEKQFGLPLDSCINEENHMALVSLLQYRYYQACLNLNRLRRFEDPEGNFLFVNIPEFRLHVVEEKQEKQSFNVIVGKEDTPTPIFSGNIEKLITNPYWTVPKSIAVNEMLPKIRKDSTYLQRNGYYVINGKEEVVAFSELDWSSSDPFGNKYCIRQANSTRNSLGLVKIIFPNEHSVYLHDTPARGLFKEKNRTFSHGCIRLENPDMLAQYLADRYISPQKVNIKKLINSRKNNEIQLEKTASIHIQYITCSGNENAELEFYNDVYKLDKRDISIVFPELAGI
ncbi:MAG TPA: L,D-transpeptidase family protein [Tenuifilaceae bacterium]|nr:L,D-transpeptidase family protein [Tenuifilaceae bacterium]